MSSFSLSADIATVHLLSDGISLQSTYFLAMAASLDFESHKLLHAQRSGLMTGWFPRTALRDLNCNAGNLGRAPRAAVYLLQLATTLFKIQTAALPAASANVISERTLSKAG